MIRLDRLVSERTGRSRTESGRAVRKGRVLVDGEPVRDPTTKVSEQCQLVVDEQPFAPTPRVVLFHKPIGVHCTLGDELGRSSLATAAAELVNAGLHPVGRLDADTAGLLLFSHDGPLTQHLLHPKRAIPRTYRARVEGRPTPALRAVLAAGVETSDGVFCGEMRDLEGDRLTLVVTEGKHRMVRRMLNNAGFPVLELVRLAYGPFSLGDLPEGQWRLPTDEELAGLAALGGPPA